MGSFITSSIKGVQAFGNDQRYADQEREQLQLGEAQKRIFDFGAAQERNRGQQKQNAVLVKGGQVVGQERALLGASGVDANSGSAARAQVATKMFAAVDASHAGYDAATSAWNYEMKGVQATTEARLTAEKLEAQRNDAEWSAGADWAGSLFGLVGGK